MRVLAVRTRLLATTQRLNHDGRAAGWRLPEQARRRRFLCPRVEAHVSGVPVKRAKAAALRADPGLTLLLATGEPGSPTETALRRLAAMTTSGDD
jgi:hypothetical protein